MARANKDFWRLFPDQEHHYARQCDKRAAVERIGDGVARIAGRTAHKVEGGRALGLSSPEGVSC